jgi:hypothetical protein
MRELPQPTDQTTRPLIIEEYWERRVETADGRLIDRWARRVRWDGPARAQAPTAREVVEAAAPLVRALVATVVVPALGRLAVRALAPRLLRALPPEVGALRLGRRARRRPRAAILAPDRRALDAAPTPRALPPGD